MEGGLIEGEKYEMGNISFPVNFMEKDNRNKVVDRSSMIRCCSLHLSSRPYRNGYVPFASGREEAVSYDTIYNPRIRHPIEAEVMINIILKC